MGNVSDTVRNNSIRNGGERDLHLECEPWLCSALESGLGKALPFPFLSLLAGLPQACICFCPTCDTVSCDLLYMHFYVCLHKRLSILMAGAMSSLFLIFLVPNAGISPRWGQHSFPSPSRSLTLGPCLISSSLHLIYIMGRGRARAGPRGLLLQLQSLPS